MFSRTTPNSSVVVPVAERIDVSQWWEATLMLRVHSLAIANTADNIQVVVAGDGFTADDPTTDFVGPPAALETLRDSDVALTPLYRVTALTANFGSLLRVAVIGNRDAGSGGTDSLEAELSMALSLKS